MMIKSAAPAFGLALLLGATAAAQPAVTTDDYRRQGQAELRRLMDEAPIDGPARNVILFIGDGMGISTLTAARIFQGQLQGADGESLETAMDRLSHTALVKTYSHDGQVSDSAPTATALLAGIKTRNDVIGVGPEAAVGDCTASRAHHVPSIMAQAQTEGRATGIVSTARITHATPAATYAHTPQRDWESDSLTPADAQAAGCADIARQMIEGEVGARMNLILGGGRAYFLPQTMSDPEYPDIRGRRADGRDLTADWVRRHPTGRYVWNAKDLTAAANGAGPLLGLFEPDHMRYEADRAADPAGEPSLAEMTRIAIDRLAANPNGYVLMIEAGRIDHAHHAGNARRALHDAVALDEAVAAALAITDRKDTLVVVTSDHSHTFTIGGYPARGNPLLGLVTDQAGAVTPARDGKPFTTLGYANGPGAVSTVERPDPSAVDTTALDYRQQALIPLVSETHGGDDVVARASGPMAHLFRGTIEQHTIYHIMREAMTGPPRR